MALSYMQAQTQVQTLTMPTDTLDYYQRLIDSSFMAGHQGRYAEAEAYLGRAIKSRPKHPLNALLLNNLGGLQELQQRYDQALLSYSAALELMPTEQTTRANRARLFVTLGNYRASLTDYSILVAQAPSNEVYRYQRAMTYILDKQYDLAEIDLESIIRDNAKSLKARIGYALLETMRGHYDQAERLYAYLLEQLPNTSEVYEGRARLYLARGMSGFALRDANKALELAGTQPSPSLYRLRAEIYMAMGDERRARQDLQMAPPRP